MQFESIFNSVHAKTKELLGGLYDSYIGGAPPSRSPPKSTALAGIVLPSFGPPAQPATSIHPPRTLAGVRLASVAMMSVVGSV
jgi:hypothetical protein